MAKKLGKFMLFTAAVGAGAAAAFYYLKKKDAENSALFAEDDDYDDFSDSYDEDLDSSRNYVPLSRDSQEHAGSGFVPLSETVANPAEDAVEEFFDEEDPEENNDNVSADE